MATVSPRGVLMGLCRCGVLKMGILSIPIRVTFKAWMQSPGGTRIASGSDDGTAQAWDAADGGHAYMYHGHSDYYLGHSLTHAAVNSVTWSPGGTRIASGSSDKTVQVW